ncbi:hypothetical protein QJS10_CPA09g00339 [Acorus calamus]|uniref:Uncharacterized protein n=1 Tax=Acorus calamus TaxID=4465 RepID=A0AAV9E625_ACOCL|nr:hypothetical protein QJS10_CPA09g00339 [Acorus calamus]
MTSRSMKLVPEVSTIPNILPRGKLLYVLWGKDSFPDDHRITLYSRSLHHSVLQATTPGRYSIH